MVFTLASQTGWSEDFIVWELPFDRAVQYQHAALYANGAWTVPAGQNNRNAFNDLLAEIDKEHNLQIDEDYI